MRRERLWSGAVVLALVAAVAAAYAGVRANGFVLFDDDQYVYENAHVRAGLTLAGLRWALVGPHSINWHPLTSLSHMLDVELFGLDPGLHHLSSVALHALASALLFLALRALTGRTAESAFVAGLFALHPLRVESVAWVSERKDVLSGACFAGALWAYAAWARRGGAARYALVTALVLAGLASKPMLVTLPFLLLVLDDWPLGRWRARGPRALVLEKLPWLALAAAVSAWTLVVQQRSGAVQTMAALDLPTRVATALQGVLAYVEASLWPARLAFYYPHPALVDPDSWNPWGARTALALVLVIGGSVAALALRRRAPWVAVGWLWFLGMLVPVCGLVQVGEQAWADRYAYLPTVGLTVAAAFSVGALVRGHPRTSRVACAAGLLALLALGLRTRAQCRVWRSSETLFEHALAVTSRNAMAANNLGLVRLGQGRVNEALALVRSALDARPDDRNAGVNLGIALARSGRADEAEIVLRALAERLPRSAEVKSNLASVLAGRGQRDEARRLWRAALALRPDLAGAHLNLGLLALAENDAQAALPALERACALQPWNGEAALQRARALELLGRSAQARDVCAALADGADDAALRARAAAALAWLCASAEEPAARDGERALALARALEASQALEPWRAQALLAAAQAERGDFPAAVRAQERALALAPPGARAAEGARLDLYRSGRPARGPRQP